MTVWNKILSDSDNVEVLRSFATRGLAKNEALSLMAFEKGSGEFRNLVRRVGADRARQLTRRALRDRKLV